MTFYTDIVSFLGVFEDEYLVLEYCALGSLSHLLETKGNELKYEDLVSMMFEASKGMEYLERQSVIHSDLCTHSHPLLHLTNLFKTQLQEICWL
jgi:serine/threonine protein kinase